METEILLVEDEQALVLTLTDLLTSEGYRVRSTGDGEEGLRLARENDFDAIVLDVMLPGMSGFDLCRELRRRDLQTPILMLTARGQIADKVLGLKLGADDYLTKPFEPRELLARLEALRRRASAGSKAVPTFRFGPISVDFRSLEVRKNGEPVELSAREFELLRYFIHQQGVTLPRERLLANVWNYDPQTFTRTVDVHVGLLRQKLEEDPKNPRHFLTVRGFGYKFVPGGSDS